jgi:hypothetical protein
LRKRNFLIEQGTGGSGLKLATWETKTGGIAVLGQPREIVCKIPAPKSPEQKWIGGVAQTVECLLCKCEVLSSNPCPTKKKKF